MMSTLLDITVPLPLIVDNTIEVSFEKLADTLTTASKLKWERPISIKLVFPGLPAVPWGGEKNFSLSFETEKSIYPAKWKHYIHRLDMPFCVFNHPTTKLNHLLPDFCDQLFLHVYCPPGLFDDNEKIDRKTIEDRIRHSARVVKVINVVLHKDAM